MKTRFTLAPLFALALCACTSGGSSSTTSTASANSALPLVEFAQANSADPWRQVFDSEIKAAAAKHASEFQLEEQAAEDDPNKQISQIETMMLKSPKVLLVSPTTEAVRSSVEKVYDSGIPVVLLDRAIPGDKYTCLIAGDNVELGRMAGEYIAKRLNGKGTVLMVQGLGGATATTDRRNGALTALAKFKDIKVIQGDDCKYQRQAAQSFIESFLQSKNHVDAIYAHNDEMAIGSYLAWSHSGDKAKRPVIVGIDGCQKEMIDYIKKGQIDATFKYPVPAAAGIEVASQLLKGQKPKQKKVVLPTTMVTAATADKYMADNPNLAK